MEVSKIIESIQINLEFLLEGKVSEIVYNNMAFGYVDKALETFNYIYQDFDSNSWQVDYWAFFIIK